MDPLSLARNEEQLEFMVRKSIDAELFSQALKFIDKLMSAYPDIRHRLTRAEIYFLRGDFKEALVDCEFYLANASKDLEKGARFRMKCLMAIGQRASVYKGVIYEVKGNLLVPKFGYRQEEQKKPAGGWARFKEGIKRMKEAVWTKKEGCRS